MKTPSSMPILVRVAWLCALVFSCVSLAACGQRADPDAVGMERLTGPPLFRAARENLLKGAGILNLRARGACRVRFRIEQTGREPELGAVRHLAPGEGVRVWWQRRFIDESASASHQTSNPKAAAHRVMVDFGFEDQSTMSGGAYVRSRPGRSTFLHAYLMPSSLEQEIPFGTEVELGAVALVDVDEGEPQLVRRSGRSVLRSAPETLSEVETVHVLRLYLSVEAPEGGTGE